MNETDLASWAEKLTQLEKWVSTLGPGGLTIVIYIILGYVLKSSFTKFPGGARGIAIALIPLVLIPLGIVAYKIAAEVISNETGSITMVYGLVYCLAAWLGHKLILSRIIDPLLFAKDDTGQTQFITKKNRDVNIAGDSD